MWRYADIRNVPDIVRHWATVQPDRTALVQGDRTVSYSELDSRSNRIAQALTRSGSVAGSVVGFLAKNSAEFFEVWFGATKAGCAIAPFNWRCTAAELAQLIDDAEPAVIFAGTEFVDTLREAQRRVLSPFEIVPFDAEGNTEEMDRWLAEAKPVDPDVPLVGTETALLAYTSGTTGRPKGVQLSHTAFQYSFLCLALEPALTVRHDDVLLMVMPNFHLAGSWVSLPALYQGAKVVILPYFEAATTVEAIARERPTVTCLVPAAIQMIMEHPRSSTEAFSSLRSLIYAGSPIGVEALTRALTLFDCEMNQFYGTTETWILSLLRPEQHDPSDPTALTSCGNPMPFVEIKVADPDGEEVPDETIGEFHVRSPVMFSGYRKQPEATAAALHQGWYRTGDLGRKDEAGRYYVVDRAKDMIITGGENVYSVEVERAIATHPSIASVAVVGAPDPKWGEKVTAFVTLLPDATLAEQEIRAHCRELIAGYKVPKTVYIKDSLPTTPSGKIQKALLRKSLAD